MAKKKEKVEKTEEVNNQIDSLLAEIEKAFGKGIVRSGDELIDNPPMVIPFSPSLDRITGGIHEGSWVLTSGVPKSGKTTSLLSFCANAQKPENGNRHICVLSAEHRLEVQTLKGIKGLKTDKDNLTFIESTKGKQLSSVDFLNIGLSYLKNMPGCVLLIDSVSALTNPAIFEKGIGTSDFGGNNKLFSQFVDIAVPIVKAQKSIILMVAQVYTNTGGYGKKYSEKIALKGKYQADVTLEVIKSEHEYGDGETEPPTGQKQTWLCRTTALTSPMRKAESYLKYGVGIDQTKELMIQANDYGLIEIKGGGWTTFHYITPELKKDTEYENEDEVKIQGVEVAANLLESQSKWLEELKLQIKNLLNPKVEE